MNSVLRNSSFLLFVSVVLCFSNHINAGVYADEVPQNIQPQRIASSQQVKQAEIKQNLNEKLLIAAKNGKPAEVRSLISQATDVNVRDEYGWTPILWAAMNGHTDVVRVLLAAGANPNTRNKLAPEAISDRTISP